ncbi:hypothetical protein [Priestia filamentosa]|uniref:hypothetical protein n=1 Tax=Priestia filamentosa TaxID=1402861 RepID=UPI0002EC2A0E|nr:hypothetical protein [Priestia filamentosa]
MASVDRVIYRKDSEEFIINVDSYKDEYKEYLFCTSPGCDAQMCYVYYSERNYGVFRKWMNKQHSRDCEHYTERVRGRRGVRTEGEVFTELTNEQIKSSLNRAIDVLLMTDEEKEQQRQRRKNRRKNSEKKETKDIITQPEIRIVIDQSDENIAKVDRSMKARMKPSKLCDRITEKDIDDKKTVSGFLTEVIYDENSACITVRNNSTFFDFKFEEAFKNNSLEALGYFHYIKRYLDEYERVPFSALGFIRNRNKNGKFESTVYDVESIRINKMTLFSLAAQYNIGKR